MSGADQTAAASQAPGRNTRTISAAAFGISGRNIRQKRLVEILRVLRPGAWLAAAVWSAPDKNPYLMIPITVIKQFLDLPQPDPTAPGIFRLATPSDLAGMLQQAGCTHLSEEEFIADVRFPSGEEYYASLMDIAAPIQNLFAKLSDEQKADARGRIITSANQYRRTDGIALPIAVRMVAGRKPL